MQQNIPEAKLLQQSRRPCWVRNQYVTRDDYTLVHLVLAYILTNIHDY